MIFFSVILTPTPQEYHTSQSTEEEEMKFITVICLQLFVSLVFATTCYPTGACDAANNLHCFQRTGLSVNTYTPACCNASTPAVIAQGGWEYGCPPGLPAGPVVAFDSIATGTKKCFKANLGTNKLDLAVCNPSDSLQQFIRNDDDHYQLVGYNLCVDRGTYSLGSQVSLATCVAGTIAQQRWLWFDGYCTGGKGFTLGMPGAYPTCGGFSNPAGIRATNQVVCLKPDLQNNIVVQDGCDDCNTQSGCSPCGAQCQTKDWWVNFSAV